MTPLLIIEDPNLKNLLTCLWTTFFTCFFPYLFIYVKIKVSDEIIYDIMKNQYFQHVQNLFMVR